MTAIATLEDGLLYMQRAWREKDQPEATLHAAGEVFAALVGYRLYTITHILPGGKEVERLYSTNEVAYPVGGRKPVAADAFRSQLYGALEPFLGRHPADFAPLFPDHEKIVALGLGSVINLPLVYAGTCFGSVNLLDRDGFYDTRHVPVAVAIAQMVVPALLMRT